MTRLEESHIFLPPSCAPPPPPPRPSIGSSGADEKKVVNKTIEEELRGDYSLQRGINVGQKNSTWRTKEVGITPGEGGQDWTMRIFPAAVLVSCLSLVPSAPGVRSITDGLRQTTVSLHCIDGSG